MALNRYLDFGSNEVIVTLYENSGNITNPQYTWLVENKDTLVKTAFYQEDHSSYPWYYNSFTLSIATYSGLTAGILPLDSGQYNYWVYEMVNAYDLNLNNAIGLVENGILYVGYTASDISTLTASNTIPTFLGGWGV